MKKKLILAMFALTCSLWLSAQNTVLNFRLTGLPDTVKVGARLIDGEKQSPVYEAQPVNGSATVRFDIPAGDGRGFYLIINQQNTGYCFVLSSGEQATASGEVSMVNGYYRVAHFKLTGSPTDASYRQNRVDRDALNKVYVAYHDNPTFKEYDQAYRDKDTARAEAITKTEGWKKFTADEEAFFTMVDSTYKAVHKANGGSWLGPFMMLTDYSYLTEAQLPELEQMSDAAKNSFYGKIVKNEIVPASPVGQVMPDFTFTDHNTGKTTSLFAVLKQSKYVLLDFWASWCRPCRMEIPNVKANYEKYHAKGFDVVSISADQREADWLKALDQEKMAWPQGLDVKGDYQELYDVQYYPTTYLLDHDGRVVVKDVRGEALGKKLAELFD